MQKHAYEIRTPLDLFVKLLDEREDFLSNPTSSRHAINCALTGWHLHEWVYKYYLNEQFILQFKTIKDFRNFIFSECHEMKTFQDLADGSKHFEITHRDSTIVTTELKKAGDKLSAFRKLDADALYVKFAQDEINFFMSFDDILYSVTWFWYNFFSKKLKININDYFENYTLF